MLDGAFRGPVDRAVRPIGRALRRTGLSPDHLTFVGLAVAAASAVAVASGRLVLGLVLVIAAALPDLFDGALAKATQTSSQRGAFLDRVTDALLLGGIAWYLADYYSGRMALLPFAVSSVASVISYQRAKAESLGLEAKGGLMERAERIVALCLGLLLEAIGVDSALIWILWAMLALITITALQRFVKVWNQAEVAPATRERIDLRRERRIERRTVRADRVARSRTVVQRRMRNERRPR